MIIRKLFLLLTITLLPLLGIGQSKTTESLQEEFKGSLTLFFYNNTLRMINQQEDKEFDEIIRDIEKMKFLAVRKNEWNIDYKRIVSDYKKERFEEVMTSRHDGKNFDIFLKEKNGKTKAMLVLVNGDDNLFVLDILGSIPMDKVTKLYSVMDESTDIGTRIERFVKKNTDKDDEEADEKGDKEDKENDD